MQSEPLDARTQVWALSLSLAATNEIDVSFSSSGYLDVSVHRVPFHTLWIGVWIRVVFTRGFPHSDISGSWLICSSPKLFAAYHVFHRLLVPRHPPCALYCLTNITCYFRFKSDCIALQSLFRWSDVYHSLFIKNTYISVFFFFPTFLSASDVLSLSLIYRFLIFDFISYFSIRFSRYKFECFRIQWRRRDSNS